MIHLFLATGFEEIEALTVLDILKRCKLEVMVVSVTGTRLIRGAHDIPVMADCLFRKSIVEESDGLILPGGMPGAKNLMLHDGLRKALIAHSQKGTIIAAICAAPMVLGKYGLVRGRRATCEPGVEKELTVAVLVDEMVVTDDNIITAKGPSAAMDFAFTLAGRFVDRQMIARLRYDMCFY